MDSIAISGIDGSGKSTLAKALEIYQRRRGIKAKVIWFRWRAFTLYILYLYSRLRGLYKETITIRGKSVKVHMVEIDPIARKLYPFLLFIDLLLAYLINKTICFLTRIQIVIYDRYFLDAFVDILYILRKERRSPYIALLYLTMARKTKVILLDISPEIAIQRKDDIISEKEIKIKRGLYLYISRLLEAPVINTSLGTVKLLKNIIQIIENR